MRLSSLLNPKLVKCGLSATTKEEALAEVARILSSAEPSLSETELLAALAEREKLGPFSMGKGIAFPHARTEKVKDFSIVLGTSPEGLDFRAPDGHKVHVVILFAIPKKHSNLYLHTRARVGPPPCAVLGAARPDPPYDGGEGVRSPPRRQGRVASRHRRRREPRGRGDVRRDPPARPAGPPPGALGSRRAVSRPVA